MARAQLEHLTKQDEDGNHRGRFKIDSNLPVVPERRGKCAWEEHDDNAIEVGHADTKLLQDDLGALGQDAVLKILAVVEQTLPKRFAGMRAALKSGDFEALARLAHVTYSSAAAAGFVRLCDAVSGLETAARGGGVAANRTLIGRCEFLYAEAMTEARALVQGPQTECRKGAAKK